MVSGSEFIVFNLQRNDIWKQCNKSTDGCHSAMPLTYPPPCYDSTVGKVLHQFLYCHLEGCSCKLFSPLLFLSLSVSLLCAQSCIHKQHSYICTYSTHTALLTFFEIISFVNPLTFLPEVPRVALLFYFSALKASLGIFLLLFFFFFHEQRFCLPLLCFNSEKQAPTHLSVFPYLLPHCVLEDLLTAQVTWVGGGRSLQGWRGGPSEPGL